MRLGGGYIKIVGGGGRKGSKEAGVVFRICTCNLIERYERGSWCVGGVDPGERRGGVCWESSAAAGITVPAARWTWRGGGTLTLTAGGRK